jgi:tetratricopeptide (TPR) repeat protein
VVDKIHAEHARLGLAEINVFVDPEGGADRARAVADAAMSVFEESGDEAGLAKAWRVRSHKDRALERFEPHQQALEQALIHLHKADDRRGVLQLLGEIAHAVAFGPTPIPDAIQRLEAILSEVGEDRELTANVRIRIGFLLAQAGRGNEALAAESEARAIFEDLGVDFYLGRFGLLAADLMLFLGRPDEAEKMLRRSDEIFERVGERGVRPTVLVRLASALFEQGRDTEAEQSARLALRLGATDDLGTVVGALVVLARIGAARGSSGAEATARRAVALAEKTDMLWNQGEAWEALASVLLGLGRDDEAREALREAVTRFERKGATLLSYRARTRFGGRVRRKPTE